MSDNDDSLWDFLADEMPDIAGLTVDDDALEQFMTEAPTVEAAEEMAAEAGEISLMQRNAYKGQLINTLASDVYRRLFAVSPDEAAKVKDWLERQFELLLGDESPLEEMFVNTPEVREILKEIRNNNGVNDILYRATQLGQSANPVSDWVISSRLNQRVGEIYTEQSEMVQKRTARQVDAGAKAKGVKMLMLEEE